MTCSNCGKSIPYAGKVCPYCRTNKTGDQVTQTLALGVGFTAGIIAWLMTNEVGQAIGWGIAGMVMGFIFAKILNMISAKRNAD